MIKKTILSIFLILFLFSGSYAAQLLTADQAFQLSATAKDSETLLFRWEIAPSYFLYADKFLFTPEKSGSVTLAEPLYPTHTQKLRTPLGEFSVYAKSLMIPISILPTQEKTIRVKVRYQGCSSDGVCYPPQQKIISIDLTGNYLAWAKPLEEKTIATTNSLIKTSFWLTIAGFFGLGVLLSLTPCVLPMIPILSSIIIGKKDQKHGHIFLLSLFYVLGSAASYALIGALFGVIGKNIQLAFQNPWVLAIIALLLILLALSLLDVFQLQLPERWRNFLTRESKHQKSGTYFGVFVMGLLSTLILSPCVTPPLVAALAYIGHSGSVMLGSTALFALGLGAGTPLLLIGILGPKILPKPGHWMTVIKYLMAAGLFIIAGVVIDRAIPTTSAPTAAYMQSAQTLSDIEYSIQHAGDKLVIVDFYADWCIDCKALDATLLHTPKILKALKKVIFLRVDVTKNTQENQSIMQHYGVIAPPTLLLFKNQKPLPESPVIGYQHAKMFLNNFASPQ